MSIFVDTSALYAILSEDDKDHRRAARTFPGLRGSETLVTTNYVLMETVSLLQRRLGLASVSDLGRLVAPIEAAWIDERTHAAALSALLSSANRRVSFVDRVSFEFMRAHGITHAFAFDKDFKTEGFTLVA